MRVISKSGSVRIDLLGGTLDIEPINLVLQDVVTLNVATSLKAQVDLKEIPEKAITIISKDYDSSDTFDFALFTKENIFQKNLFGHLNLVIQILEFFGIPKKLKTGLEITLSSGAPPGSGLGGSSAMAMTLYQVLHEYFFSGEMDETQKIQAIIEMKGIEARILDSGPSGYQDYYPAIFGGVLALGPVPGRVNVSQYFDQNLCHVLEKRLTLVFSGKSRHSGINNWEVFKAFFDKDTKVRRGLGEIAVLSARALEAIKNKKFNILIDLIAQEGALRKELFSDIVTPEIEKVSKDLASQFSETGVKICGAGGGGCFLVTHREADGPGIKGVINKSGMQVLNLVIEPPL